MNIYDGLYKQSENIEWIHEFKNMRMIEDALTSMSYEDMDAYGIECSDEIISLYTDCNHFMEITHENGFLTARVFEEHGEGRMTLEARGKKMVMYENHQHLLFKLGGKRIEAIKP